MNRYDEILELRLAGLSFAEIARKVGVSRQRVQQILAPPKPVRDEVIARAEGRCESCGVEVGKSGHVHHGAAEHRDGDWYNQIERLQLLCVGCHRNAHSLFKTENPAFKDASVHVQISDFHSPPGSGITIELVAEFLRRKLAEAGIATHKNEEA